MNLFTSLLISLSLFIQPDRSLPVATSEIFVGTTPCGQLIRPLHQIAAKTDCALVRWELTLQRDAATQKPSTYRITGVSHYTLPDNNYSQPGVKTESGGQWRIVPGTGIHAHTVIYELIPSQQGKSLRFVKLADHLLHLLDANGLYMRGDPFQSYTLNRPAQK